MGPNSVALFSYEHRNWYKFDPRYVSNRHVVAWHNRERMFPYLTDCIVLFHRNSSDWLGFTGCTRRLSPIVSTIPITGAMT